MSGVWGRGALAVMLGLSAEAPLAASAGTGVRAAPLAGSAGEDASSGRDAEGRQVWGPPDGRGYVFRRR